MICTTRGRTARSRLRFAARSGFTLIELVLALVLVMLLLGGYVRALDEAEAVDEVMRGDDVTRYARSMVISKVLEEAAEAIAPETASDSGEGHPVDSAALLQDERETVVLPKDDIALDRAAAPR